MICTFSALGRYGRAANAFFQVASTIGIARKNGSDFAFPLLINHDHRDRFGSTEDVEMYKYFVNQLPLYEGPELPERFVPWGYHDVVLTESVNLSGHMQSERYFSHCIEEVRHYFKMKDEPPQNDCIAIHYRAGDYSESQDAYHPRMPLSYYTEAMKLFPDGRFLVFSDEIDIARQMFGDRVEYAEGDYLSDFRRMKTCTSFIIANSSFSAMAAILGEAPNKRVVAPRPWFGKAATITGDDIYSDNWSVITYAK